MKRLGFVEHSNDPADPLYPTPILQSLIHDIRADIGFLRQWLGPTLNKKNSACARKQVEIPQSRDVAGNETWGTL